MRDLRSPFGRDYRIALSRVHVLACVLICVLLVYPVAAAEAAPRVGTAFVSQFSAGQVSRVSETGAVDTFATGIPRAVGMAFDATGTLYVASYSTPGGGGSSGRVSKVTPNGTVSVFVTGLTTPIALAFDAAGNLYVAGETQETITKVTPQGSTSLFAHSLGEPEGLAFDSAGNLFVGTINGTIDKITPSGAVTLFATTHRPSADNLTMDAAGNLYISSGAMVIDKVSPAGVVSQFALGGQRLSGLAFDGAGNLLVTDIGAESLLSVDASGAITTLVPSLPDPERVVVQVPEPALACAGGLLIGCLTVTRRSRTTRTIA